MPKKVRPTKSEIRKFLYSAIIDPNKQDNFIGQQLAEQGEPNYFEIRVVERMHEAKRIRDRIRTSSGKGRQTLLEMYALTMQQAATALALAVGKVTELYEGPVEPKVKTIPKDSENASDQT